MVQPTKLSNFCQYELNNNTKEKLQGGFFYTRAMLYDSAILYDAINCEIERSLSWMGGNGSGDW